MTITVLTISGNSYNVYASLAEADARLLVDPVRSETWEALKNDERRKRLVAAKYRLDLLDYIGTKTGGNSQVDKWPRTGVTYKDGEAVSTIEVPLEIQDANILIAGDIAIDSDAADAGTSGSNIKRVKAGSAEVEFFTPTLRNAVALQNEGAFKLIKCFLASSAAALSGLASGTDGQSEFCDQDSFGLDRGYP